MIRVIDETEHYYCVDKPENMSFHSDDGIGFFATFEKQVGEKLYPVHRLDKVTSGLILIAKTPKVSRDLTTLFESHQVDKYYLALSDRKPKRKQGSIVGDMVRTRDSKWMLSRTKENPSRTQFFSFGSQESDLRLFVVRPKTGRTHQVRVALKSLGSPIVGDPLYHSDTTLVEVDRAYLHSYSLQFELYEERHNYLLVPSTGVHWKSFDKWPYATELFTPWDFNWPR